MSVHHLQAPAADGGILVWPPIDRTPQIAHAGRQALAAAAVRISDMPLGEVRARARGELVDCIRAYYLESGEPLAPAAPDLLFLGGHQPELFHPGVWLKNFVLSGLARRHGALAVNLCVDSDAAREPAIRVPSAGRMAKVAFDQWAEEVPFEERGVVDEALFAALPARVGALAAAWPAQPMLADFWVDVLRERRRTPRVAERFVRARRAWERRWGLTPMELPVSRLCATESFAAFASHIVWDAARFRATYNGAVARYRHAHRVRSRNHPAPDLGGDGDWIETPFWGWRADAPQRRRLFARRLGDDVALRCGDAPWPVLAGGSPTSRVASWRGLEAAGFKVRTRALSLTLYARLTLADLFVHGLGGGKYDEVTDDIIRRYFSLEPPGFLVVTGTLRLPLPVNAADEADRRRLAWRLRDLAFNPQRHLRSGAELSALHRDLLLTKAVLMRYEPARHKERKDRFFQMRQINEALAPLVAERAAQTRAELDAVQRSLAANAVAARRDYSFCLHPLDRLHGFLRRLPEP